MIKIIFCGAVSRRQPVKTKTIFVMRLTAFLLLTAFMLVSVAGHAQKITLTEQNAPLKKIFREIKKQTGYTFFYNAGLLDKSHAVSITAKDEELAAVLDECF